MEQEQVLEKPSILICGYGIVGRHIKDVFYWADTYDIKFNNEIPIFEGDQVAIDGEDKVTYTSMCRNCRKKLVKKTKLQNNN